MNVIFKRQLSWNMTQSDRRGKDKAQTADKGMNRNITYEIVYCQFFALNI